jgi:hypothetical protein
MRLTTTLACSLAAIAVASGALHAQLSAPDAASLPAPSATALPPSQYSAFGSIVPGPWGNFLDVSAANGTSHGGLPAGTLIAARGVERAQDGTGKEWWYIPASTPTARVDKWDPSTGVWVSEVLNPQSGGGFAGRDGASNNAGKLWIGEDAGRLFEFNINPTTGDLTLCKRYVITTNGVTNVGVVRQLARDSSGVFYTGSFGGPIYTFTLPASACDGAVAPGTTITAATTIANPGKAYYGFGWNAQGNTLWGYSQDGTPLEQANEYTVTGGGTGIAPTGLTFQGLGGISGTGIAGGVDVDCDERNGGSLSLVTISQDTVGTVFTYEIAVYDLAIAGPCCNGGATSYCTAKTNSLTCSPAITSSGIPSATAGSGFVVSATSMINNKNCILFYGTTGQVASPFQGGTLCVKAPIKRTPATNTGGNPPPNDCSGVPMFDMNLFAVGGLGGTPLPALTVPGTVVDCQWWGRDPGFAAPNNTQLTNGLEYVICQ